MTEAACMVTAQFETPAAKYTETRPVNGVLPSVFGILLKSREGDPGTLITPTIRTSSLRGER